MPDEQSRAEAGGNDLTASDRLGLPDLLAGAAIEADEFFAIVEIYSLRVGGQCHRGDRGIFLPQDIAYIGIDSAYFTRLLVPGPVGVGVPGVVPYVGEFLPVLGPFLGLIVDHRENYAV